MGKIGNGVGIGWFGFEEILWRISCWFKRNIMESKDIDCFYVMME